MQCLNRQSGGAGDWAHTVDDRNPAQPYILRPKELW